MSLSVEEGNKIKQAKRPLTIREYMYLAKLKSMGYWVDRNFFFNRKIQSSARR